LRPTNKFKGYNFTPLNVGILEVLMEIKRDPEFRQPPKIPDNPPYKNAGKYCDFHEQVGHYIEGAYPKVANRGAHKKWQAASIFGRAKESAPKL
jgi:hypothetical protein